MIKLDKVSKSFLLGDQQLDILRNITLSIKKGESVSIIGQSGSGKSTLMYMIGMLDAPSNGTVFLDNIDTSKLEDDEVSRLRNERIGFVFQQFNLISKLNVLENVMLPVLYARKRLSFDPREKALALIKRFGIDHRTYSFPNKISGGEQQRVAIARALILDPEIILADEPTGNLDTKTGKLILKLLMELNKKDKKTLIIVTHEVHVANVSKRRIKIVDGEIN